MTATELVTFGQFGFAAVACYLVWRAYQELVPRLLEVIRQNSEAIAKFGGILEVHTRSIDGLKDAVSLLDDRIGRVEDAKRKDWDRILHQSAKEQHQ